MRIPVTMDTDKIMQSLLDTLCKVQAEDAEGQAQFDLFLRQVRRELALAFEAGFAIAIDGATRGLKSNGYTDAAEYTEGIELVRETDTSAWRAL